MSDRQEEMYAGDQQAGRDVGRWATDRKRCKEMGNRQEEMYRG
jgi:hypothetical protein